MKHRTRDAEALGRLLYNLTQTALWFGAGLMAFKAMSELYDTQRWAAHLLFSIGLLCPFGAWATLKWPPKM